jgi:hypothetical protein
MNFKLGMMIAHDQQMTPIDFVVKGQGHIDLVGNKSTARWSIICLKMLLFFCKEAFVRHGN